MPELQVSVVIPTFRRRQRLSGLLATLHAQQLDPAAFEVIVVDDGGDAAVPAGTRLLRSPGRGPAAARNAGWRAARAPLVAFTDDDCRATPGWLTALLAAARARPGAVIQGRTVPDPAEAGVTGVLTRTVRIESLGPQYETCNIAYPRAVLEALGGFDEAYGPRPSAEDTDLAWRALEQGVPAVFAPNALVFHAVERVGLAGSLRVARRWEAAMPVFAAHPGARQAILFRGRFWNAWHYLLWRSLAALAAPRWLRRLLIARHLWQLRRRAQREGSGAWAVAFLLLHDLVECWAVARGAVRAGIVVL